MKYGVIDVRLCEMTIKSSMELWTLGQDAFNAANYSKHPCAKLPGSRRGGSRRGSIDIMLIFVMYYYYVPRSLNIRLIPIYI